MSPISRRSVVAVVLLAAILTVALAVPLQAAVFQTPPPPPPPPAPVACSGFYYRVLPGDTLSRIGWRFGVSVARLVACNGLANANRIFAGQLLLIPRVGGVPAPAPAPRGACWYKIRWGDTLNKIARRYGTSVWYLMRINNIANANRIYAGRWLRVPC